MVYLGMLNNVGNTPMIHINDSSLPNADLYVKLESYNPTGSVKDRASQYVINKALGKKIINYDTTIIESSSGNFGISLSSFCKRIGLKCTLVIDPNILPINEYLISLNASKVIKVTERDETGGFLLTRTRLINKMIENDDGYYWTCQYSNPLIAEAYYQTLGVEICDDVNVDYIFLGVSSGGTITGVSNQIKERYPNAKVIAVDVEGSVIFNNTPCRRYIPGIGSSMHPEILDSARIDEVIIVSEMETIRECREFAAKNYTLIGGSSGSVYAAIRKYFANNPLNRHANVVAVFADRGDRYADTVYNNDWVKEKYGVEL